MAIWRHRDLFASEYYVWFQHKIGTPSYKNIILESVVNTDEIFIASGWPIVCNWFHFLQLSFSTKCPPKKSGRENWCFLKEKRFVTPVITPYGFHIFVNFPTTTVLQNKPALSARARAAWRAIYLYSKYDKGLLIHMG